MSLLPGANNMQSPIQRPRRSLRSLYAVGVIAILYVVLKYIPSYKSPHTVQDAGNSTLGFEKILVIGLKERTDRRDVISLQSSLSSLDVEYVDGVKGEDIIDKALPYGRDRNIAGGNASVGSYRGHIDAVRSILDNHLSSALIMEDDMDWDIRIKSQMVELAKGARTVLGVSIGDGSQKSPYGDDWDIIWPGHCGEVLPEWEDEAPKIYVISNDETVAPKQHQPWLRALESYPEHTRIVQPGGAPICTFAYAVSYKGAQKIMAELAIKGNNFKYDNALAWMCRDRVFGVKCVSVQPMLFYHHRSAGKGAKDSDIEVFGDPDAVREKGFTDNIVLSTRLNVENLVAGKEDWVMQW